MAERVNSSPNRAAENARIITDTSDFFDVGYDDIVILGGRSYLIRHNAKEGRFGIDDEEKYWVKRAIDLETGKLKILKLVFNEVFESNVGGIKIKFIRSQRKEHRILQLVQGHDNFMQGFTVRDSVGNRIRIIDFIRGDTLGDYLLKFGRSHENYYQNHFPAILNEYIELVEAIAYIHDLGDIHGDIRRDHAIRDEDTGKFRWIDFDFNYTFPGSADKFSFDLLGLGNVLACVVGRGEVTVQQLRGSNIEIFESDLNLIFSNRIANLKKVYPYISDRLDSILLRFSNGAEVFYDNIIQLLTDLKEAKDELG